MPVIKVLLGSKRQARNFLDIYILVILVSKQFATFLHISLVIFSVNEQLFAILFCILPCVRLKLYRKLHNEV
jgi:hypothetical protein